MELTYVYQKERRDFGKQCLFSDKKFLMCSVPSNHEEFNDYILRDPVSEGTQIGRQYAVSDVNTERVDFESKGINHTEGGWPKDVNFLDAEQTVRYRRKIEKDENYINQVMGLSKKVESCINQNNAVNIYENYFEDSEPAPLVDRSSSRTVYVYRDVDTPTRQVSHMSWSPDGGSKIAITYCNLDFQKNTPNLSPNSYIWETENPNQPLLALTPSSSAICLEYNQKDPNSLISGQFNGQVSAWDTRTGSEPTMSTPKEVCHRESVNSVLWINSKSGTEFFSGGADGQVIWWDTRKLNERMDILLMDPEKCDEQLLDRCYGVSVLEYETTIPTRFMVGTEQGMLFSCNRKGKTPLEKITMRMPCHAGPITTLSRNPVFIKNFLTVGDWIARIWSEDCRESSIIWTKHCSVELTDGCWSPTKSSIFYISRMDGVLESWDLLQQQSEPVLRVKICDDAIKCLKTHESGRLVACGSGSGSTYLVEVSENMVGSSKNDKPILTAMLDRESKREKILEAKLREIKLKVRQNIGPQQNKEDAKPKIVPVQSPCETAESDYMAMVDAEMQLRTKQNEEDHNRENKPINGEDGEDAETHETNGINGTNGDLNGHTNGKTNGKTNGEKIEEAPKSNGKP